MSKAKNHCIDCGAEISRRATRCHSCAAKERWSRGDYNAGTYSTKEYHRKKSEAARRAWERGDHDGHPKAVRTAWKDGAYDNIFDDEYRRRHSEAMRAAWERGDYDNPETRRKMGETTKASWERGDYDGVFQSPTSIELQIIAALDIMGIDHQSQFRPDGISWVYDEFVPPNMLIEVQGTYWHSLPKNQERDAEKARWAEGHGYKLIEIWDTEIEQHGAWSIVAQLFA